MTPGPVAIVGAGMAGLSCAAALRSAGIGVTLFDKGRAAGGRVATRRRDGLVFNHGAQYATARTAAFRDLLLAWEQDGAAAVWTAAGGRDPRWTGVPGMSALPRALAAPPRGLAAGADVRALRHVLFLHDGPDGWHVRHGDAAGIRPGTVAETGGEIAGPFSALVLAVPAPQAAPLLAGHAFHRLVNEVRIDPCWAVMLAVEGRLDAPDFQRLDEAGDEPLAVIARDGSRPTHQPLGPDAPPDRWVLHATPAWSRAHLEREPGEITALLLAAFARRLGHPIEPSHQAAHRWRHAQTVTPLGRPYLWDGAAGLGVCGDWCLGARVEDAVSSGRALAGVITARTVP